MPVFHAAPAARLAAGLLALLLAGAATARDRLPATVRTALERARVPADAVSVLVAPADGTGRPRLSHRIDVPMNPASVMKLVTTFAALETLGPAWSWTTPVYVEGTARDGTLYGNLYIKGQGDPKLVVERLWLLLRRVQGLDIRRIAGDIVLDRSAFEVVAPEPGEFDGEPLRPYNAAPDALLLNYKSVLMTFVPDRSANAAHLQVEPPLAGVQWPTHIPLRESACGDYRGALRADFSDPSQPRFAGRYPVECKEQVWPLAYAEPDSYNARAVEGMWRALGGELQGRVRDGRVPEGQAPAFEFASPPLAEVVRDINKYSNNVMTQQLFLTLSLQATGSGTLAGSRALLQDWWRARFGADAVPQFDNGSGLSREDRVTARALGQLLQYAWASPRMPELLGSLPITGQDGTLRRMRSAANGSAHLKTGSLRDVTAVAGYVHAPDGRRQVVVMLVNHPNARAARAAVDALLEWVLQPPPTAPAQAQ